MTTTHEPGGTRRDHLWVVGIIAACALLEVWASWLGIGSVSGFPKLGRMTTGWILPVSTEAYWGYALYAWLAASSGPRSRRFAMWTAVIVFTLSMLGQEAGHLLSASRQTAPWYVQALATALPLIALGLIAILVHLRQLDREEARTAARKAAEAERLAAMERAEADERTALREQVDELTAALSASSGDLAAARQETEAALAKVEVLTRKLAGTSGAKGTRKRRPVPPPKRGAVSGPEATPISGPETPPADDVDTQAAALEILASEPGISGSELGRRLGKTERYGCMLKKQLSASGAAPEAAVSLDDEHRQA